MALCANIFREYFLKREGVSKEGIDTPLGIDFLLSADPGVC
jgi:hypothetical protein